MDLPNKPTFRVGEVAQFLDVSERTVLDWIARGPLGSVKVVGSVRIPRVALLALCGTIREHSRADPPPTNALENPIQGSL